MSLSSFELYTAQKRTRRKPLQELRLEARSKRAWKEIEAQASIRGKAEYIYGSYSHFGPE